MKEDLESIAESLNSRLLKLMAQVRLTPELVDEHGSYLARLLANPDKEPDQEVKKHVAALYMATEPWPPATVGMLTINYLNLRAARNESSQFYFLKSLINTSFGIGYSSAELELSLPRNIAIAREMVEHIDGAKKREQLAQAGLNGGDSKNAPFRRLKEWAITEAKSRTGSAKQIARQLTHRIPADLQDVSVEPERIIYEALLAAARTKMKDS